MGAPEVVAYFGTFGFLAVLLSPKDRRLFLLAFIVWQFATPVEQNAMLDLARFVVVFVAFRFVLFLAGEALRAYLLKLKREGENENG